MGEGITTDQHTRRRKVNMTRKTESLWEKRKKRTKEGDRRLTERADKALGRTQPWVKIDGVME